MSTRLVLALCAAAFAPALAFAATPREDAEAVAKVIEAHYFDAARGHEIAEGLRAEAAKGSFDGQTNPRDLATALTRKLQPIDHHFAVIWNDAPPPAARVHGGPPIADPAADDEDRRANYGFRTVSVLPGNIGYIDLREFAHFEPGGAQPAREAADAALKLVSGTDAVIIDLRDNGGGSPAMVGYLTSAFTPAGADIYNTFHSRHGDSSEAPATPYAHPRLDVPVYVLTSGRTGSAAEALAYTLQTAKRATVVGDASGGAANPGGVFPAGDGFAVFVSTGAPINPISKKNWEGGGVQPDLAVPAPQALDRARLAALEGVVKAATAPQDARWALAALKAETGTGFAIKPADYVGAYAGVTVSEKGGVLVLRRDRRPAVLLTALGEDTFTPRGDPSRRYVFRRDPSGRVVAFEVQALDGRTSRYARDT